MNRAPLIITLLAVALIGSWGCFFLIQRADHKHETQIILAANAQLLAGAKQSADLLQKSPMVVMPIGSSDTFQNATGGKNAATK
jgi:hypothetical protein